MPTMALLNNFIGLGRRSLLRKLKNVSSVDYGCGMSQRAESSDKISSKAPTFGPAQNEGLEVESPLSGSNERDLHATLTPLGAGLALVNQTKVNAHNYDGPSCSRESLSPTLYTVKDSYLADISWVLLFARHNRTFSPYTTTVEHVSRLVALDGKRANEELRIGTSFDHLTFSFGESKTFSSLETSRDTTFTVEYTIPAGQSLYLYQRRFTFIDRVWWKLQRGDQFWTVSRPGDDSTPIELDITVSIDADEIFSSPKPLTGTSAIFVQEIDREEEQTNQPLIMFKDIPLAAQLAILNTCNS